MKIERLREGWVNFTRFHFKDGYIDKFMGDMADDPNSPNQVKIHFNASSSWIRLNKNEWVNTRKVEANSFIQSLYFRDEYTAEEVWNAFIQPKTYKI